MTRFSQILHRILKGPLIDTDGVETSCEAYGRAPEEVGTHSLRKGAVTYVSGGCTGGPSAIATILRAGWTLNGVEGRYFRYEAAGDQFTGRTVTGLPLASSGFGVLPSHFIGLGIEEKESIIDAALPGIDRVCSSVEPVVLLCIASLAYHREFLRAVLSSENPVFQNRLFRSGLIDRIAEKVSCGERSISMTPSGTTVHSALFKELQQIRGQLDAVHNSVKDGGRSEEDRRKIFLHL